ncbi:MAG: histidine phosphatase family protein [Lentisphaeraceae bacterium]|nr:histidine phosphatase family protein [Lentisphaeraceae bacterium]
MKRLVIMRHAQSPMGYSDVTRPISPHGKKQAFEAGQFLKDEFKPDYLLVSSAERTRMTIAEVAKAYDWGGNYCQFEDVIYNATLRSLIGVISKLPDEYENVMLVGHNPGVSQLVTHFSGGYGVNFTPATVAILESKVDNWYMLATEGAEVTQTFSPA